MKIKSKSKSVFEHIKKNEIKTLLNGLDTDAEISFDEIRTVLNVDIETLPDGAIHQIALDDGFEIEI